jgi:hypothetical protein
MSELFLTVLNMSLKASYVILFVIIVRLLLQKSSKSIFLCPMGCGGISTYNSYFS